MTGEDYEPETLVIAQMFPGVKRISNTRMATEEKDGKMYITCRIGFEEIFRFRHLQPPVGGNDAGKGWVPVLRPDTGPVRALQSDGGIKPRAIGP